MKNKDLNWIELKGGEETSHIIIWCTRKVRHPAKCLILTETTVTHHDLRLSPLIGCSTQRPWGGEGEKGYWIPLSDPMCKQRLRWEQHGPGHKLTRLSWCEGSEQSDFSWLVGTQWEAVISVSAQPVSTVEICSPYWDALYNDTNTHVSLWNICAVVFVQERFRMVAGFDVFSQLLVSSV